MCPLFSIVLSQTRICDIPSDECSSRDLPCKIQKSSDKILCGSYRSVSKSRCVFLSSLYCISLLIRFRIHKTSVHTEKAEKNNPAVPVPVTSLWLFYGEDIELRALLYWLWRIVVQNVLMLRLLNVVFVVSCSTYHVLGVRESNEFCSQRKTQMME
jgi:hypothetical protein